MGRDRRHERDVPVVQRVQGGGARRHLPGLRRCVVKLSQDQVDSVLLNGSIDLAWMLQAQPWQLRMAAEMFASLAPWNPMTAAVLRARADNLDPDRTSTPI